jgi:hypothetical protein
MNYLLQIIEVEISSEYTRDQRRVYIIKPITNIAP